MLISPLESRQILISSNKVEVIVTMTTEQMKHFKVIKAIEFMTLNIKKTLIRFIYRESIH